MKTLGFPMTPPARRGSALVLALLVVMVLAGLGTAFLLIANSASQRQSAETDNLRAFYLAEAGLAESFQALRIGRSGQLASQAEPAVHGEGLIWVDATDTADEQVRLTSTALCGTGRSSLALVVEPVDIPLGFFSDEDLVVESVLLVDGFNSEELTYEEQVGELPWVTPAPGDYVHDNVSVMVIRIAEMYYDYAYREGDRYYYVDSVPRNPILRTIDARDFFDAKTAEEPAAGSLPHTDSGGLLSSNGDIRFTSPAGEPVEVWGDVIPGPDGSVEGLDRVQVMGDTDPRSALVELPAVEVPPTPMAAAVRHDGLLPMVISAGTSGHERIEVAAEAELVLRGPATVVIDELILEPGALMTLDTRDGDVALYVTNRLILQPDSEVVTTSDYPDELTIQVAAIPSGPNGAPVKLRATSQFHGTVYAPETEVRVGSNFEIYGGIVARKLSVGPGARLHFDSAEFEGSPIPRLVSWRIVQIPRAVRNRRTDPFAVLAVSPDALPTLSEAHDLASVQLSISYADWEGVERSYIGSEDQFDWLVVGDVLKLERIATRPREDPAGPARDIRPDVQDKFDLRTAEGFPVGGSTFVDNLIPNLPLSADEWDGLYAIPHEMDPDQLQRLKDADLAAGGSGG